MTKEIQLKKTVATILAATAMLAACGRDADIASRNLSVAAGAELQGEKHGRVR